MTNDITSKVIIGMDVKQFRKGVQNVDSSIRRMSKRFQNLGSIIGASFAFSQIQSFGAEAIQLNSQLTKAAAGFKRFGDAADLASMRKSTMGLVTDLELMQQSVKGANLGIPIRDMGILLEFAKRRADETGESMDHLVNSIVEGIGRKSTRRLDNLGISAQRLKEAVGGVSLEMADVADVSKAMVGIAEEELAKMGDATITAADKMTQLSVEFQNAKASAGELFAALGLGALQLFKIGKFSNDLFVTPPEQKPELPKTTGKLGGGMFGMAGDFPTIAKPEGIIQIQKAKVTLSGLQKTLKDLKNELQELDISGAEFNAVINEIAHIKNVIKSLETMNDFVSLGAKSFGDMNLETKGVISQIHQFAHLLPDTGKQFQKLTEIQKQYAESMAVINMFGQQFGMIFKESFSAAMISGEDLFTTLKNGFQNYLKQMAAMTAATLAFAMAVALLTGGKNLVNFGTNFVNAFTGFGGSMGLPFTFGQDGKIKFNIAGSSLEAAVSRSTINNSRLGG